MRTRVTDYTITIDDGFVFVNIAIPAGKSPTSSATTKPMREAIRLIIDETAKVTFCSSMKKDNIVDILPNNPSSGYCSVKFSIPEGKTITASDHFTIEMDWGDVSESGSYSEQLAQFFGLPDALPGSYQALTQAEVIASSRAEQVNVWGEDGCPIPNYLPEGITEQMVEAAAIALGITYYEPNFNIASL